MALRPLSRLGHGSAAFLGAPRQAPRPLLTPRKILMALEQVVPVVPQGTFSVMTRKPSWALPFPPQWSWGGRGGTERAPRGSTAGLRGGGRARQPHTLSLLSLSSLLPAPCSSPSPKPNPSFS